MMRQSAKTRRKLGMAGKGRKMSFKRSRARSSALRLIDSQTGSHQKDVWNGKAAATAASVTGKARNERTECTAVKQESTRAFIRAQRAFLFVLPRGDGVQPQQAEAARPGEAITRSPEELEYGG